MFSNFFNALFSFDTVVIILILLVVLKVFFPNNNELEFNSGKVVHMETLEATDSLVLINGFPHTIKQSEAYQLLVRGTNNEGKSTVQHWYVSKSAFNKITLDEDISFNENTMRLVR